jgi:hypothetical protein
LLAGRALGAIDALQAEVERKKAELVSLRSSSTERLATIEEERVTTAARLAEALRQAEDAQAASDAVAQEAARKQAALEAQVAELTTGAVSSTRALGATWEQNASLRDQLGVVIAKQRQLPAVAIDHDRELTGSWPSDVGSFRLGARSCWLTSLLVVAVVAAACVELHLLQDWRAADAAWTNEAITKQKELTALVSLLADGLTGEL